MIQNKYTGECLEPDKIMSPHYLLILPYLKISEQNQYCHVPSCLKPNNYLRLSGFYTPKTQVENIMITLHVLKVMFGLRMTLR